MSVREGIMTDRSFDLVVDAAKRLMDLRNHKAQLEQELVATQTAIERCVNELASVAVEAVRPVRAVDARDNVPARLRNSIGGSVLVLMQRNPEHGYNAREIAAHFQIKSKRSRGNIRTLLARMARDGRIVRSGYGRYRAKQPSG
jgi:hypothetical protein